MSAKKIFKSVARYAAFGACSLVNVAQAGAAVL